LGILSSRFGPLFLGCIATRRPLLFPDLPPNLKKQKFDGASEKSGDHDDNNHGLFSQFLKLNEIRFQEIRSIEFELETASEVVEARETERQVKKETGGSEG
jgi:hypothetical protein